MGPQSLLLMMLLLIAGGGDPVAEGIKLLTPTKAVSVNRIAVSGDLINLAARAHQFYNRPAASGGGGNSFAGLTADATGLTKLTNMAGGRNANGTYSIQTAGFNTQVTIQGVGTKEVPGGNYVTMRIIVRDQGRADSLYQVY